MANKTGLRLYGFEEFIEALQKAESVDVDRAAENCFNQCADIVIDAMKSRMSESGVPDSLKSKATTFRVYRGNAKLFSYGWNKSDEQTVKKVCYLNYGTPRRQTHSDGQRVQIGGEWVTLGNNRGKVAPRYFISNAKRSAAQKMRKVQKDALKQMLGDLKK